jgi:hypothetical protein
MPMVKLMGLKLRMEKMKMKTKMMTRRKIMKKE